MEEAVSHKGVVIGSDKDIIRVEIVSESACASCHVSGLCGIAESKKKVIEVPARGNEGYAIGQEVEVCLARRAGMKAVLFSYLLPVLLLLILILSLPKIGFGELATGALSLLGVAGYYFILFLCRDRLAGEYEFYIRKR